MKEYLKKLVLRIIILISIVIIIPFVLEFLASLSKGRQLYNEWHYEDELINQMNTDKLQNKNWGSNPLWLHEGETLPFKREGVKRILVVGDSYIWGDGYSNANHIWWQQFRQKLKESGYNNVEIVAAGVGGYSTQQEFEDVIKNEELMNLVDPDLIVIGFVNNDPEFRNENYETYYKVINSGDLFYDSDNFFINKYKELFPFSYNGLCLLLYDKFEYNETFHSYFGLSYWTWLSIISSDYWLNKYETEVIKPLKDYLENDLDIPYFFYITYNDMEPGIENIMNMFEDNNVKYYFAPNYFINKAYDEYYHVNLAINPANNHPSVVLCKEFAEVLVKIIESDYSEFLGEKGIYTPNLNINDWMPHMLNVIKVSDNMYSFVYPASETERAFLTLPAHKPYVKLNLEEPLTISNISIEGNNIEEIELFVNKINKNLGYDDQDLYSLGVLTESFEWEVSDKELITSINISAKIKNGEQANLLIKIN
ncbi:MAG: SGNH/GDSL hydrolase family protein [Bacilli bacterium]|nr:SGNH/GDSL hydrolase family protein [Bacilli bacterium]